MGRFSRMNLTTLPWDSSYGLTGQWSATKLFLGSLEGLGWLIMDNLPREVVRRSGWLEAGTLSPVSSIQSCKNTGVTEQLNVDKRRGRPIIIHRQTPRGNLRTVRLVGK